MSSPKPEKGDRLQITVDALTSEGWGVGRVDGFVVFVSETAPGDTIEAEIVEVKKRFARARCLDIVESSPHRQTPPCPVFHECGGCQWQHIKYKEQLRQKMAIVESAVARLGGLTEVPGLRIEASPKELRYRNRIQVHYGKGHVGFFSAKSHKLIPTEDCLIAEEPLIAEMLKLKKNRTQKIQRTELRLGAQTAQGTGSPSFAQVNRFLNPKLVDYVVSQCHEISENTRCDQWVDLYSGSGNFSIPLAQAFANSQVLASDLNREAIQLGSELAQTRKLQNLSFHCEDATRFVASFEDLSYSSIVLDPPRAGTSEDFWRLLAERGLKSFVYVSCNPATLARDLRIWFSLQQNARLTALRAFDLFPQTPHVETVATIQSV